MNILNSHNRKTQYRNVVTARLLSFFAGNANAIIEEAPKTTESSLIESPLKFIKEISLEKYMTERDNFGKIMEMITYNKEQGRDPDFEDVVKEKDRWVKSLKGNGYIAMISNETGMYLFHLEKKPTQIDMVTLYAEAKMVGRYSRRIDEIFGIRK